MTDPGRAESAVPQPESTNAGQAEALLVDGLDRYFAGQYEEAIQIWTRVLFLDRAHARARAYIDRARTAIAERQRRFEEMLHASQDLLERGHVGAARSLLIEAVAEMGDDERAAAIRVKLERVERAHAGGASSPLQPARPAPRLAAWFPSGRTRLLLISGALIGAALLAIAILTPTGRELLGQVGGNEAIVATHEPASLPVLSSTDLSMVRARSLFAHGRLSEALQTLDRIGTESPARTEADALRTEIQKMLLSGAQGSHSATGGNPR